MHMSDMENFKVRGILLMRRKEKTKAARLRADGQTKKYELKGVENYDGICKATVPEDITLTGFCGNGEKIKLCNRRGQERHF